MSTVPKPKQSLCLLLSVGLSACVGDAALNSAVDTINADDLLADIQTLSSDEFGGRAPSSPGEEQTINHLKTEFEKLGLEPGAGGSFFQEVPLVAITANPGRLDIRGNGARNNFDHGSEFVAGTKRVVGSSQIRNSELVFVGYGVVAPEYDWDDFAAVDVRDKTIVVLVNDPGFATEDPTLFNGRAMTYYGRWTYKFEEAARRGVDGIFIVHETEPAAYGWGVVERGWTGAQFGLVADDNNMSRAAIEGWWTVETARAVFEQAGLSYDSLKALAQTRDFQAIPMGLTASVTVRNEVQQSTSNNVLALLPGTDRADEYFFYMGHWDHFGTDPSLEGDQIFNGALDNATGTAALIELAEAFVSLEQRPSRSIVFMAVTAEEQGLLGSEYYGSNPVYPLENTVAALNMDALNILGPMNDISIVGYGNSELDDYLIEAAATQDRTVSPDPRPEAGSYYRSDHFNFAKVGVPAIYPKPGVDHVEYGADWSQEQAAQYTADKYHQVTDEYSPDWDLAGMVDDLGLFFRIGYRIANESTFPNWSEGSEFKAMRDAMMGTGITR
jgi:Zn-dependent M28 family amino/carboxypeptidase